MKEKLTYKYACSQSKRKFRMLIMFTMLVTLLASGVFTHIQVNAASVLKVRYLGKTKNYTGAQLAVNLDGSSVNLKSTPGLALKNAKGSTIYMVSAADVFQKAIEDETEEV